jgi:hypothetical protein
VLAVDFVAALPDEPFEEELLDDDPLDEDDDEAAEVDDEDESDFVADVSDFVSDLASDLAVSAPTAPARESVR